MHLLKLLEIKKTPFTLKNKSIVIGQATSFFTVVNGNHWSKLYHLTINNFKIFNSKPTAFAPGSSSMFWFLNLAKLSPPPIGGVGREGGSH